MTTWFAMACAAVSTLGAPAGPVRSPAPGAGPPAVSLEDVDAATTADFEQLLAVLRGEDSEFSERAAARAFLEATGAQVVPVCLAVMAGTAPEPEVSGEDDGEQRPGPRPESPPPPRWSAQELAEELVLAMPRIKREDAILGELEPEAQTGAGHERSGARLEERLIGVRWMAVDGDAGTLAAIFRLMDPIDDVTLSRPFVGGQLSSALGQLLDRDSKAYSELSVAARTLDLGLLLALLPALEERGGERAQELFEVCIGRDPELDRALLESVARLSGAELALRRDDAMQLVRPRLQAADPRLVRAAITAAGELADPSVTETLVEFLSRDEALISSAAARALCSLSGLNLPPDEGRWRSWWQREELWRETRWPELVSGLASSNEAQIGVAARQLVEHPLWRRETAELLGEHLMRSDGVAGRALYDTLLRVADPEAERWLTAAAQHRDPALSALAQLRLTSQPTSAALR